MRLRRVLDHGQVVVTGQRQQRIHICRLPIQMHRDDRLRAPGDGIRHLVDVDGVGPWIDVDEHRRGAGVPDGRYRRDEGERHGDHLVTRPDTGGQQRQMQSARA